MLNLYDIQVASRNDREQGIVDTSVEPTPELQIFPPDVRQGKEFESLVLKSRGTPDIFTRPGRGVDTSKDNYQWAKHEAYPIMRKMEQEQLSEMVEDSDIIASMWDERRMNETQNLFEKLAAQLYLGRTAGDPLGFPGFNELANPSNDIDALNENWNEHPNGTLDASDLNAAAEASLTNAYLVVAAPDARGKGLKWFYGGGQQLAFGEKYAADGTDADGKTFPIWRQYLKGWIGLTNYTPYDVVKIKNVPTHVVRSTEGNALFLMNVITKAMDTFPSGWMPTHLLIHHKAYTAMHNTMQNYNHSGAGGNIVPVSERPGAMQGYSNRFARIPEYDLTIVKSRVMPTYSGIA